MSAFKESDFKTFFLNFQFTVRSYFGAGQWCKATTPNSGLEVTPEGVLGIVAKFRTPTCEACSPNMEASP